MNYYKVPERELFNMNAFVPSIDFVNSSKTDIGMLFGCNILLRLGYAFFKSDCNISKLNPELEKFKVSELEYMAEML